MLRHTLDRVALAIPPERTVIVSQQRHADYMAAEFYRAATPHLLVQPENRGTAAGVLFPAHWIHWHDPKAIVAVFPSDHFIPDGPAFMAHARGVAAFVSRHPERVVLLGARPTEPETDYGWIEPGATLGRIGAEPIFRGRRFLEKPSLDTARTALSVGCLWNTFVFVATTATLLAEGRRALPELSDRLARIAPYAGTEREEVNPQPQPGRAAGFVVGVMELVLGFDADHALVALLCQEHLDEVGQHDQLA